ncbi:hypothetical protein KUTG_00200 [Kutzneria sp. 744]|nr:hypothetical protein KUTG_00200 [Kutzneria sp. 744]
MFLPRRSGHWFRNTGVTPAKTLVLVAPGGFEQFFAEAGTPARAGEQPPPVASEGLARIAELSDRYGASLVGSRR